jgi:xylulose-5-phosphate/fructose-6-phosphate phosphoketolase
LAGDPVEVDQSALTGESLPVEPQTWRSRLGSKGANLKQVVQDKLVERKLYIDKNGQDMPGIRNWKCSRDRT